MAEEDIDTEQLVRAINEDEDVQQAVRNLVEPSGDRRDVLKAAGAGLLGGAIGGAGSAGAASDTTRGTLDVGSQTANTYRISGNRFGGPDSARPELTNELGSDDAGARFAADDTGAEYYWTGSAWDLLPSKSESVQTGEINHTLVAEHFDGSDGGAQIQAALDKADSNTGVAEVIVGPDGPDAGDIWEYSSALEIGDDTILTLVGCTIKEAAGADVNALRNKTATGSGRNTNITVRGIGRPVIDGNAANATKTDTLDDLLLRWYKVDGLEVRGLKLKDNIGWLHRPEDVTDVVVKNIEIEQTADYSNGDGFKVCGPFENVTLDTQFGVSSDDFCGFACDDPDPKWIDGSGGNGRDITFQNIQAEFQGRYNVTRLLSEGYTVDDISISDVTADGAAAVIRPFKSAGATVSASDFSGMTVTNVTATDATIGVYLNQPCEDITISDCVFDVNQTALQGNADSTHRNISISNVIAHGPGSGSGTRAIKTGEWIDCQFRGLTLTDFQYGVDLEPQSNGNRMSDVSISNIPSFYIGGEGVRFGANVPPFESGTATATGGASPAVELKATDEKSEFGEWRFEYRVASDPSFNANYGLQDGGVIQNWNDSTGSAIVKVPLNWSIDPGSGNDVSVEWELFPVVLP